jgi:four helix bundle protein
MATVQQFEDLNVWQEARQLVKDIYAVSRKRDFYRDAGLREQIRRACVSTMSNIAEGFERGTRKEFIQFLHITKGSNGEARSQLFVALGQGYLDEAQFAQLRESAMVLSRRIAAFIRYLGKYPADSRVRKTGNR